MEEQFETRRMKKQAQRARDAENNAKALRAAAEIASKSGVAPAVAVGEAVKAADSLTGGKASKALAKTIPIANKALPPSAKIAHKFAQKGINALGESGLTDAITKALSMKSGSSKGGNNPNLRNGSTPQKSKVDSSKNAKLGGLFNSGSNTETRKETEEQTSDGGLSNFEVSYKVIKWGLIASIPVFVVVVFCCLIISSSQIFLNAVGIDAADSVSSQEGEEKINKLKDKDASEEITDSDTAYDIYIMDEKSEKLRDSKLKNYVQISYIERKYREIDLDNLHDFYPPVKTLSEDYDEKLVIDFFYKMYNLNKTYRDNYGVNLNLPLLMATLRMESEDINEVFEANLSEEDRGESKRTLPIEEYDYYHDWSNEKVSKDSSVHDMEILAQHMVVAYENSTEKSCANPKENICYEVDVEGYKEFLKEFLEKKYYIEGGGTISSPTRNFSSNSGSCAIEKEFTKYDLTQEQLEKLASVCYYEQGTPKGAAAEASLMANLFEMRGSSHGTGAEGLYNYVRNSGWFAYAAKHMDAKAASPEIVDAVKSVLVDGKRTLPGYIDEHDCISCSDNGAGDITSVTNNGVDISKTSRDSYISHTSIIKTKYGATYTFYAFPTDTSDPFGYTSEAKREEIGEFHYDYDTGKPVGCVTNMPGSTEASDMAEVMINIANQEYELNKGQKGGKKYWKAYGLNARIEWCAIFAWYVSSQTEYEGVKLYPDIIKKKSASTGDYMRYFNTSPDSNIKFYYNDSCSQLSGKNGSINYIPKPGDYIFFAWGKDFYDINKVVPGSGPQDHTALVEKYEDGKVYTIEGNISNALIKRSFKLTDCRVIGFGSWY